jgi:hypothetical protein
MSLCVCVCVCVCVCACVCACVRACVCIGDQRRGLLLAGPNKSMEWELIYEVKKFPHYIYSINQKQGVELMDGARILKSEHNNVL